MTLDQLLSHITIEDVKLVAKALEDKNKYSNSYDFDTIDDISLNHLISIKPSEDNGLFGDWFGEYRDISEDSYQFLEQLLSKEGHYLDRYSYENLKVKFISPFLNHIDFTIKDKNIKDFYESHIHYQGDGFILKGDVDYIISKGVIKAEEPYLFAIAFREDDGKKPILQLIAELISMVELNEQDIVKGAYISGAIWNFVILEKVAHLEYIYHISDNFDSSNIDILVSIYNKLIFIKEEITQTKETTSKTKNKKKINLKRDRPKRIIVDMSLISNIVWLDTDNNLYWQKEHEKIRMTWDEANKYAQRLNDIRFAGFENWRLPTLDELQTLITSEAYTNRYNYSFYIKEELIDDMQTTSSGYWTSTLKRDEKNVAWYVYFSNKQIGNYDTDFNYYVRCVRDDNIGV